MKNTLALIGLLFIGFSGLAQDKTPLLGKWVFREVYEKENVEAEKREGLTAMFADVKLEFGEKEALLTMMGRTETAQWQFSEADPKFILVTSKTGKVTQMELIKLDEKELVITFGKAGTLVLVRP